MINWHALFGPINILRSCTVPKAIAEGLRWRNLRSTLLSPLKAGTGTIHFLNFQDKMQLLACRYPINACSINKINNFSTSVKGCSRCFLQVHEFLWVHEKYKGKIHAKFLNYIVEKRRLYLLNLFIHTVLKLVTKMAVRIIVLIFFMVLYIWESWKRKVKLHNILYNTVKHYYHILQKVNSRTKGVKLDVHS